MMVTFVSQCEKNALKKTRRVLDAFADRIGDNTWQTIITEDGLQTVKRMLKKTASKSTAVSCHWIRSRSRSQFLWVVGSKDRFNSEGVVPVNSTRKNLLNSEIESDWKYLPLIKALTGVAALLHDWGKASKLFQEKLKPNSKNKFKGDPIRHEWISILLLNALVTSTSTDLTNDTEWLTLLANGEIDEKKIRKLAANSSQIQLNQLPQAAQLIAWLIVSHHRLPNYPHNQQRTRNKFQGEEANSVEIILQRISKEWGYENRRNEDEYQKRVKQCFQFPNELLSHSQNWLKLVKRWASGLLQCLPQLDSAMQDGSYRSILHYTRMNLMLGDHSYSSQDANKNWKTDVTLYANTHRETGDYKQKLDEHIVGVTRAALRNAHLLPAFEKELPLATNVQKLRSSSPKEYRWQDKAVGKISEWKKQQEQNRSGFFAVNMASTGCGKTFANAKVMRALSVDSQSLRYVLALGLRTLTLQTGDEYRDRIGLDKSQLAVLIGSKAVTELHHHKQENQQEKTAETLGSESEQPLLVEEIEYESDIPEDELTTVLTSNKERSFLYAPVLTCTIDHLMSATETKRGGRYILPSLRLMSSDLVIDEIDDFTGSDLIAIGRLIHLAGMLGRKVMISSATIPPSLALGYFNSYQKGWQIYCASRDNAQTSIGCAWIDEFNTDVSTINVENSDNTIAHYQTEHNNFINKRVKKLITQIAKRKATIIPCAIGSSDINTDTESREQHYYSIIKEAILAKHQQQYSIDPKTGINVSFGVVRMANISPCVALTQTLLQASYPQDIEVKVMAYHSQQVLLLRHLQEKHLDEVLKRKEEQGETPKAFSNPVIRQHLDKSIAKNIIFILVATPVEEVGRDHDFDWAIIEPSSYRSIVQLAGRVRRHRKDAAKEVNIGIMQYNLRAFKESNKSGEYYFKNPGYEDEISKPLDTHDLNELVDTKILQKNLTAIPRIQAPLVPKEQVLASLEHYVTARSLADFTATGADSLQGYLSETWFLTALPQVMHPFRKSEARRNLFLAYSTIEDECYFTEKDEAGKPLLDIHYQPINRENILNITRIDLTDEEKKNLWLERDYESSLTDFISEPWLISKRRVSLRYGELNIPDRHNTQYHYSDQLGLFRVKK